VLACAVSGQQFLSTNSDHLPEPLIVSSSLFASLCDFLNCELITVFRHSVFPLLASKPVLAGFSAPPPPPALSSRHLSQGAYLDGPPRDAYLDGPPPGIFLCMRIRDRVVLEPTSEKRN